MYAEEGIDMNPYSFFLETQYVDFRQNSSNMMLKFTWGLRNSSTSLLRLWYHSEAYFSCNLLFSVLFCQQWSRWVVLGGCWCWCSVPPRDQFDLAGCFISHWGERVLPTRPDPEECEVQLKSPATDLHKLSVKSAVLQQAAALNNKKMLGEWHVRKMHCISHMGELHSC